MTCITVLAACCICKHQYTGVEENHVGVVHAPKYGACSKDLYRTIVVGGPPGVIMT